MNLNKIGYNLQIPFKWGMEQVQEKTKPANTRLEKIIAVAERLFKIVAAIFCIVLGAVPFAIGKLLNVKMKPVLIPQDKGQKHVKPATVTQRPRIIPFLEKRHFNAKRVAPAHPPGLYNPFASLTEEAV